MSKITKKIKTYGAIVTFLALAPGIINYSNSASLEDLMEEASFRYIPAHERVLEDTIMSGSGADTELNDEGYSELFERVAQRYSNQDPFEHYDLERILPALMIVESQGDKDAISPRGARGILQIMPNTFTSLHGCNYNINNIEHRILQADCAAQELIRNYEFLEPYVEGEFGNYMLATQRRELTELLAISAYNNGIGNLRGAIQDYWPFFEGAYLRRIPFTDGIQDLVPEIIESSSDDDLGSQSLGYLPKFMKIYEALE